MRARAQRLVEDLQDQICATLEGVDGGATFREERWERSGGGGGRARVLSGGEVIEKAGVNTSVVQGVLPEELRAELPGEGDAFFATGISLIVHPRNPHAPTTHMNARYLERGGVGETVGWFGGGSDLTPLLLHEEDARSFHEGLAAACAPHGAEVYPVMKAACDEYFRLPHRAEHRGVGGVFFDTVRPGVGLGEGRGEDGCFALWRDVAEAFAPAYEAILRRRVGTPFDERDRAWQLSRRGRYVEFNLLYDRGTRFGLLTGGRSQSILVSMPPLVRWDEPELEPHRPEAAALLEVVRAPREWLVAAGPDA